jgi:hypothetical protein
MYMSVICLLYVICYSMCICVITYYCKVVVGPGAGVHHCTLSEVWVLGVGMSTLDTQTDLCAEDRGLQVPMSLEHVNIVVTQCCDTLSRDS